MITDLDSNGNIMMSVGRDQKVNYYTLKFT